MRADIWRAATQTSVDVPLRVRICEYLKGRKATIREISAALGCTRHAASVSLHRLRAVGRVECCIVERNPRGGRPFLQYALPGVIEPVPEPDRERPLAEAPDIGEAMRRRSPLERAWSRA